MAKRKKNECAVKLGRLGGLATAKKRKKPKRTARKRRTSPKQKNLF